MAPVKPTARSAVNGEKFIDGIHILDSLKSSILSTKLRLSAFRNPGQTRVTKSSPKSKTVAEREHLKRAVQRLSAIEGSPRSPSSSPQAVPSSNGHTSLQGPSMLTARDFEVGGTLGKGKFGRVYLARHLSTNYICALKIISKAQCTNEEEERLIRRELEVHQNLTHKNILKLLSWFHDNTSIYLVLEYAPGGSLYSRLQKQPKARFDERTAARYIAQMAEALRYMHGKNIMHRDIKPENILLGLHHEIKLADFGYSVHSESGFRSTVCGTLDYLSPEVAIMLLKPGKSKDFYTRAIDQWSLGVMAYELLVGKPPFEMKTTEKTQKKIAGFKGKGIKFPAHVSKDAEGLIRGLLNLDAEKRMELDEVLVHPWIVRHVERAKQSGVRSLKASAEASTEKQQDLHGRQHLVSTCTESFHEACAH